jgi:hypothetical protein
MSYLYSSYSTGVVMGLAFYKLSLREEPLLSKDTTGFGRENCCLGYFAEGGRIGGFKSGLV